MMDSGIVDVCERYLDQIDWVYKEYLRRNFGGSSSIEFFAEAEHCEGDRSQLADIATAFSLV
jgi:hypothetical protein